MRWISQIFIYLWSSVSMLCRTFHYKKTRRLGTQPSYGSKNRGSFSQRALREKLFDQKEKMTQINCIFPVPQANQHLAYFSLRKKNVNDFLGDFSCVCIEKTLILKLIFFEKVPGPVFRSFDLSV